MISLRDVRKVYPTRFGENLVLNDVSFDLAMGERLGVLGRNGAGKSTMIRLISGAEKPTSGLIEQHMSVSWPLAFGGAFQPMLTGVDNIRFISRIYAQDFEKNLAFVEDFAELGPYLREPVRTYSSGMRARLAFAISMIIEFDCFLIDEIGAVGDARFHDRCNYELFEKRGDRAMVIISHDAAYVRDHCNRYAVLHDAKLTLYDDFDEAYGEYSRQIGVAARSSTSSVRFKGRAAILESLRGIAFDDERFRVLVQQGDWARDRHDWVEAEQRYAAALALHPYEKSYWAQHAHVTREQGKFADAEISYRTAGALGVPVQDIQGFLRIVLAEAGHTEEQFPIFSLSRGEAGAQPPSRRDVEILALLFWAVSGVDRAAMLDLLRTHPTLDDLASSMILDPRMAARNEVTSSEAAQEPERDRWLLDLCYLSAPRFDYLDQTIRSDQFAGGNIVQTLESHGGFSSWPKTRAALEALEINDAQS